MLLHYNRLMPYFCKKTLPSSPAHQTLPEYLCKKPFQTLPYTEVPTEAESP